MVSNRTKQYYLNQLLETSYTKSGLRGSSRNESDSDAGSLLQALTLTFDEKKRERESKGEGELQIIGGNENTITAASTQHINKKEEEENPAPSTKSSAPDDLSAATNKNKTNASVAADTNSSNFEEQGKSEGEGVLQIGVNEITASTEYNKKKEDEIAAPVAITTSAPNDLSMVSKNNENPAPSATKTASSSSDANTFDVSPTAADYVDNSHTEAIVVTTRYVDECLAARLRHLMDTAQTNRTINGKPLKRDVWVLHNHQQYKKTNPLKVQLSEQLIQNITGLKSENSFMVDTELRFDGSSGTAKRSFLRLIVQHQYSHGWHIEDDVYYTGPWREVFDATYQWASNKVDVVPVLHAWKSQKELWEWEQKPSHKNCTIYEKSCKALAPTATGWMIIRVSFAFAKSLRKAIMEGHIDGHHGIVVGAFSKYKNFTVEPLKSDLLGFIDHGHWGKYVSQPPWTHSKLEHHAPIVPSQLYHPVKCSAYQKDPPGSGPWKSYYHSSGFWEKHANES